MGRSTVEMSFSVLWTHDDEEPTGRTTLDALTDGDHIHGDLCIAVGGRIVPWMGYFGPEDVCFDTWIPELLALRRLITAGEDFLHVFDEGEQGQPAFEFRRTGEVLLVSINDGAGGGRADDEWQGAACSVEETSLAVDKLTAALDAAVRHDSPVHGPRWLSRVIDA